MEEKDICYKVLWVDDDPDIVEATVCRADIDHNIELDHVFDWESAKEKLLKEGESYSALILDAHCKKNSEVSDDIEMSKFLSKIGVSLGGIMQNHLIPWYIYSAGDRDKIVVSDKIEDIGEERKKYEELWGKLFWKKTNKFTEFDELMNQIKKVASLQDVNIVKYRHHETFKGLDNGVFIGVPYVYDVLVKGLCHLYFPKNGDEDMYEGTPLRKVVEYIFRTVNKVGILPNEFINDKGHVNLTYSSLFLAGEAVDFSTLKICIKYGKEDEAIFPLEVGIMVHSILDLTNPVSHTPLDEKKVPMLSRGIYFSCILQLCEVIKWLIKFVSDEKNIEEVKEKIKRIPSKEALKDKRCVILEEAGILCVEHLCMLSNKIPHSMEGKSVIIRNIVDNTDERTKEKYPYYIQKYDVE